MSAFDNEPFHKIDFAILDEVHVLDTGVFKRIVDQLNAATNAFAAGVSTSGAHMSDLLNRLYGRTRDSYRQEATEQILEQERAADADLVKVPDYQLVSLFKDLIEQRTDELMGIRHNDLREELGS